jgi:RNA polymerase sigma factor (sigma-70 family)
MMRKLSDARLLQSGAAEDFGRFYERHLAAVTAFIGRHVRSPDALFDLTAETFARALEHRDQYDPSRGPAIAWLLGIARNLLIDSFRRGQVAAESRLRLGIPQIALDDEQLAAVLERGRVDLHAVLEEVPEDQRESLIRHVVLGQSYAEIATSLRCSPQVIRKRVSRGLTRIRRTLEEHP